MKKLFESKNNQDLIAIFKNKIDRLAASSDFEANRNQVISGILDSMISIPDQWDLYCQINIEWIGDHLIDNISGDQELSKTKLDNIASICFRFLLELDLSIKGELNHSLRRCKKLILESVGEFHPPAKDQIEYAIREMPIAIFKSVANSDAIDSLKSFNKLITDSQNLKKEWEEELSSRESRVNKLKDSLSEYENGFNFVGLYQGFDELAKEKEGEKKSILQWLRVLSIIILIPILFEFFVIYRNVEDINKIKDVLIVSIFPTLSLLAIIVYYFRILLLNYKSVKSQLLQLDLRKTLCKFIQSYSEYSKDIKAKDASSLEKFESIIFSGIVPENDSIPSTFDGVDQFTKLIKSMRKN